MGLNIGYLQSDRTVVGDELYTPVNAVLPIKEYVSDNAVIWCPFDTEDSSYVKELSKTHHVIFSHLQNGEEENFLTMCPPLAMLSYQTHPLVKSLKF